ncbi:hypothetical protein [Lentzea sp. NPDC092896]
MRTETEATPEAPARLRRRAFVLARSLDELAGDVVTRRLSLLEPDR